MASSSATAVAATTDGGFVVAGTTMDAQFHKRGTLWRFDSTGKLVWQQTYGQRDGFLRGVAVTPDSGAVVGGAEQTANQPLAPWLVVVDPQGAQRYQRYPAQPPPRPRTAFGQRGASRAPADGGTCRLTLHLRKRE